MFRSLQRHPLIAVKIKTAKKREREEREGKIDTKQ